MRIKYEEAYARARDICLRDFDNPTFENILELADKIYKASVVGMI